jgi:hypothetical protein
LFLDLSNRKQISYFGPVKIMFIGSKLVKERDHLGDLGVNGLVMLISTLKK